MGIDARVGDAPTAPMIAITVDREGRETDPRARVRAGEMRLRTCQPAYRGYRAAHAAVLEPQFPAAIPGR
ncbi:MAG: hypothetical protein ACK5WM_22350 [Rhodospirillales bacterium]